MAEQTTDGALQAALRLHRSGRFAEAKQAYDAIVAADVGNVEAWHLLGVLAYQAGDNETAVRHIDKAITLGPADARFHQNRGNAYLALGRIDAATSDFARVCDLAPSDADGPYGLGLCHLRANDPVAARGAFEAAIGLDPDFGDARLNLGLLLARDGIDEIAGEHLSKALKLLPDHLAGWLALARIWAHTGGDVVAAVETLRRLAKDDAEKLHEIGLIALGSGEVAAAEAAFDDAITLAPDMALAHFERGNALYLQGRNTDAIAAFERALAADPGLVRAGFPLAAALSRLERNDEARRRLDTAVAAMPDFAFGQVLKAAFERRQGDAMAARAGYGRALALDGTNVAARWGRALTLPQVYESDGEIADMRAAWLDGMRDLEDSLDLSTPARIWAYVEVVRNNAPFYLHYQGFNDREPQRRFGSLVERIARAAFPEYADFEAWGGGSGRPSGRRRVGFVSGQWHWHTVHALFKNWIGGIAGDAIEPFIFYTGTERDQAIEGLARKFPNFRGGLKDEHVLFRALREARLDVVIYPDIGMIPATQLHAALRFAPRQWMSWGHPVTSGLSNMDGFLTSDLMEPENGQDFYTETLIRLPNLSIDFDRPAEAMVRTIGGDKDVLFCPQSLFKLLPSFDRLVARIAAEVPKARFRFIAHKTETVTRIFQTRLAGAFKAVGADYASRVEILPRLDQTEFFKEINAARVLLDAPSWSGGRTSLEAFACGKPTVTAPGAAMRGRHTAAMYRRMGLPDLICADEDAYVARAIRWMTDESAYSSDCGRISAASGRLYGDTESAAALAALIMS